MTHSQSVGRSVNSSVVLAFYREYSERGQLRDQQTIIANIHITPYIRHIFYSRSELSTRENMESDWFLERRDSGCLVWCRKAAKVKFRCEVDVLEFWPGEYEKKWEPCCWDRAEPKMETSGFAAALCLALICMVVGFKVYC